MNEDKKSARRKAWAKIIAKSWSDDKFKKRFKEHPNEVLKEYGIELPEKCEIHENTPKIHHLVIPAKPDDEMTEEDLQYMSSGGVDIAWDGYDASPT
jgi:hypothetical protein